MTCATTRSDSLDALLQLLADSCRRTLVRVLAAGSTEQSIDDVVDRVVAESWSDSGPPDRSRIRIELHHKHLPALDDHGVVDYDSRRDTVTYCPDAELESLLEVVAELESDTE